jgi:hypothetical protein
VTRRQGLLLTGLLALGAALRVYGVASHALWIDEYGTWWAVAGEGYAEVWRRVLAVQGQSPLYYVIVRATVDALGTSPLALRLPSLACGLALLALAYPLGRRLFGSAWLALLSVAAFAVSERLVYYSQEARPYALALLLACASFLFYLECLRGGGWRASAGYLASTAGAFYAHYLFGAIAVVQGLHLTLLIGAARMGFGPPAEETAPCGLPLWPWLARAAALAVLFVPGLAHFADLGGRREELDWVPPIEGDGTALAIAASLLDPWVIGTLAAAALVAAVLGRGLSRPGRAPGLALAALWLAVPIATLALLWRMAGVNLLDARYAAVAVPAAALLYAFLMGLAPGGTRLRALPLAVFLAVVVLGRLAPHLAEDGTFSDRISDHRWEETMGVLLAAHREGDRVLYRTRYVELDAVVEGTASPEVASFVEWPLLAHWPAGRPLDRRALPYGRSVEIRRKAGAILHASLAEAPRVWLVGHPHVTRLLVRHAEQLPGVHVARRERYGQVLLVLLVPAGDAWAEP